ncbi:MAG TPA: HNH endonuclease signature motif containing protein [Polyangiaceae bacterium]|nr:HNH endonuclease signature motif containing protein [Polyangiaceae bacterium]
MKTRGFWRLDDVSDLELVTSLQGLVGQSAWTEARLVAHLAELETRRLHLTASRSLFAYCQERLGLSQNEAYYRIVAARLGRKFPIVFELLEQRKVHLTALALIRDYVTADNHLELLSEVSGKTMEQILQLLAARRPRPDARSQIRKLPIRAGSIAAGPSGRVEPLSQASYRLELCIDAALKQKLELAADLMSHANPGRDLAIVVEHAVDELIEKLRKRRFGQKSRSRERSKRGTRAVAKARQRNEPRCAGARKRAHIPNELRRQLAARDGASCSFICDDGRRCGARAFIQIHHDEAWAKGGPDTLANLRLVCASHNRLLAEKEFGAACVQSVIAIRRRAG